MMRDELIIVQDIERYYGFRIIKMLWTLEFINRST